VWAAAWRARPLAVEEGLDGFAKVFDEMKPIHHLYGLRCPTAQAIGVERTPVATDHGDGGMLREPGGYTLRRALGQQVEHPVILQIDEDGPIAVPPPPRPLVTPNDLWARGIRRRGRLPQPQQGGWARPQSPLGHEPRPGFPAEGEPEGAEELRESRRPSCPRGRDGGQAFRENLAQARGIITEKFAHPPLQAHGVDAPRQIGEGACIPAMDPRSLYVAERAGDTGLGRGHVERALGGSVVDVPRLQGQRRPIR
jgi:hypothetical protein